MRRGGLNIFSEQADQCGVRRSRSQSTKLVILSISWLLRDSQILIMLYIHSGGLYIYIVPRPLQKSWRISTGLLGNNCI
jgi:hypothetical protein